MSVSKRLLIISTYFFFVLAYIEETIPFGQVITLFSLALMLLSAYKLKGDRLTFPLSGLLLNMAAMLVYCTLSALWAEDPALTSTPTRGLLMKLLFFCIVLSCHYKQTRTDEFLKIIMYGGYTVVVYAMVRYGWSTIMYVLSEDLRLSTSELMNSNSLGMGAAYSIVINLYYILYGKRRIADLLIIPSAIIIAASGSRKSIIIIVLGSFMLIFLKNYSKKNLAKNILKSVLGIAISIAFLFWLSTLPIFSNVVSRLRILTGDAGVKSFRGIRARDIREVYNMIGWDLFKSRPILGIGIYNASRYISQFFRHPHLHNNFIELLACGGIVGFSIHYSFYAYLFISFFRLRKWRTAEFDVCLVLLIIRFVMGYGYIQFFDTSTYFYLMVIYLYIKDVIYSRKEISELSSSYE